jgi:hypothetical protein
MRVSKAYFFKGGQYVRYDSAMDRVDEGYPANIATEWAGLSSAGFDSGLDAAANWGNGKAYFFKDGQYLRYDIAADRADPGYPVAIAGAWPGLAEAGFGSGIDAVANWGDGKAYFFKDSQYVRYDMASDRVDDGYPTAIAGAWPGLAEAGFASGLDAVVNWGDGKAYFFKRGQYVRYDIAADRADPGYPTAIAGAWPGLAEAGFGTALSTVIEYEPRFGDASDIDAFFTATTGQQFLEYFRDHHANKSAWANVAITTTPAAHERFQQIWGQIPLLFAPNTTLITLEQFASLMSIIINETGGSLLPLSEKMGTTGHPGLSYAFDVISGKKISYNKTPNRTALTLFNDADYNAAHGQLAMSATLRNTQDPVWAGQAYPQPTVSTSEDPAQTGYIEQADFYKFRGRGLIQTTFRSGYVKLIGFIQNYAGLNSKVLEYRVRWTGQSADLVATRTTNADWDDLFQHSDLLVPLVAIAQHNSGGGNYLRLSLNPVILNGTGGGSIYNVGLKVSGSTGYATKFRTRVKQILNAIPT